MSVENLMFMYSQINHGCPRNIDCGFLRRIGKTSCIKQLIQNSNRNFQENIVLVPSPTYSEEYRNIAPIFVVSPWSPIEISRRELFQSLRGSDIHCFIYADEVRNAEEIVDGFETRRATFEVGFYSMPYGQRRPQPERPMQIPERIRTIRREHEPTLDELLRARARHELITRHEPTLNDILRAERLISESTPSQRPNFFETSWVEKPATPSLPIETEKVNMKMRFIT